MSGGKIILAGGKINVAGGKKAGYGLVVMMMMMMMMMIMMMMVVVSRLRPDIGQNFRLINSLSSQLLKVKSTLGLQYCKPI